MALYLVHACNQRLWYVRDFLLPSMINQGIDPDKILVYRDKNNIGNLRAWVDSCNRLTTVGADGVWHLQDDVVICKDFKERTEQYDSGLVCGFTCAYNVPTVAGKFKLSEEKMWFSFPCIRIPMDIIKEFTEWANKCLWQSEYFRENVMRNNADDLVFREWLYDGYPDMEELNLAPNLVNHIDYLIDGSVVNKGRNRDTTSIFWEDNDIIEELKGAIEDYRRKKLNDKQTNS